MIAKDATARPRAFYAIAIALPVTEVTASTASAQA
jgi:hypothetical protein